jgi:isocitrate dehydrogenase
VKFKAEIWDMGRCNATKMITDAAGKPICNKKVMTGFYKFMNNAMMLKTSGFADEVFRYL